MERLGNNPAAFTHGWLQMKLLKNNKHSFVYVNHLQDRNEEPYNYFSSGRL
jgi:hypothetical protein